MATCELVKQRSASRCAVNVTFGCQTTAPARGSWEYLWVGGGCRGTFMCGRSRLKCGDYYKATGMRCACNPDAARALEVAPNNTLDAALVANGTEHFGSDNSIACLLARLRSRRRNISILTLGGSISAGSTTATLSSSRGKFLYHELVAVALRSRFGLGNGSSVQSHTAGRHILSHNGAIPATGPDYFEQCLGSHLVNRPDLVLLEFSVNMDRATALRGGQAPAFERLIRRLLDLKPLPAIVVINSHVWLSAAEDRAFGTVDRGRCFNHPRRSPEPIMYSGAQRAVQRWEDVAHGGDEDGVAAVCRSYNVPLVSMRAALLSAVKRDASVGTRIEAFMKDCKHPNSLGHVYLSQLVLHRLLERSPNASSERACASSRKMKSLRPPMSAKGWTEPMTSTCHHGEALLPLATNESGTPFTFQFVTHDQAGAYKPGYIGNRVGQRAAFLIALPAPQPLTRLVLRVVYLRSWLPSMARARFTCTGCSCDPLVIDAKESSFKASISASAWTPIRPSRMMAETSPCMLHSRVLPTNRSSTATRKHFFKVLGLVVETRVGHLNGLTAPGR